MPYYRLILFILLVLLEGCGDVKKEVELQPETEDAGETEAKAVPNWKIALEKVTVTKDAMIHDLETAHRFLTERARVEDPQLLAILEPTPPKPREYGYGILPEIKASGPHVSGKPIETYYSIKWLENLFQQESTKAKTLKEKAEANKTAPLKPLVDEYSRLKKQLNWLESHLSYHRLWQTFLDDYPRAFDRKNQIKTQIRAVMRYKGDLAALRNDIWSAFAKFVPAKGLQINNDKSGAKQLNITLDTDITDDAYLNTARAAIESEFNQASAAQAKNFRIHVDIKKVDAALLYPEGVPKKGDKIDLNAHMARFPPDSLILSTGGKSTHVIAGRMVVLGPDPIGGRTLAHEFAHLLGFTDIYLRAYDGHPNDPYGVTFVEWSRLYNDLMGDPGGGEVSELMIDKLIQSYSR